MFDQAMFAFGVAGIVSGHRNANIVNLVSNTGVVSADLLNINVTREYLAGTMYGDGCSIFGYGLMLYHTTNIFNKVSNSGIISSEITAIGTSRAGLAAAEYGAGCAIFAYGNSGNPPPKLKGKFGDGAINPQALLNLSTLITNTGIIGHDSAVVGTVREGLAATGYGQGKAVFAHGYNGINLNLSNSVSDTGVVDQDNTMVGTSRRYLSAARFGVGQAIFGYGGTGRGECNTTNLVSDTGIIGNDVAGVGVNRVDTAAAGYGGDRAIFGFGLSGENLDIKLNQISLVSNTGIVSQDRTTVGTGRFGHSGTSYGV